ncbi:unnamed protein product [Oikopleura dioica]|uniref:Profilin n=1 Tax=Oikopleura dioica TaxID=34765 RepID=E4XLQ2_OIKDI|nr:unnamed protein product [Oikopleura dioica]
MLLFLRNSLLYSFLCPEKSQLTMLGTGGWDIYVSGVNGFVGKDGVTKGGLFDANSGNPWCQQDCSRLHPAEVTKMIKALEAGNKDEAITCSKVKFNIVAIEKDNTLMHAFGPKNIPMVMKITEGKRAIVIGFGDENSNHGSMTAAVERTVAYLNPAGY